MAEQANFDAKVVELVSPLPLEKCCHLLQAGMDRPLTILGSQPVIGRIVGAKLHARKRIWYRNSFQTRLSADLLEQDGKTRIRCRFSMHPFVTAFMAVWFGGVLIIGGVIFVASLLALTAASSRAPAGTWLGILIPIGMLTFGIGLMRFGRYIARDERRFLITFIRDTLKATPA